MKASLLRIIHTTLSRRALKFEYNDFPKTLTSLNIENPSEIQINKDLAKINYHFHHPVFVDYVPTYYEMVENPTLAWLRRYSASTK